MPRQKRDQDAGIAIAAGQTAIGGSVHGGHFEKTREAGEAPAEGGKSNDQLAHGQTLHLRGAGVSTGNLRGKTPCGLFDQHPHQQTGDHAKGQPPMHVPPRHIADAQRLIKRCGRWFIQAGRIAQGPLHQMVHQRNGDIGHQQAGNGFIDPAIVPQRPHGPNPERANAHPSQQHDRQRHKGGCARQQNPGITRANAAQHDRPFAADNNKTQPRGQRHTKRRQQKRRRP